MRLAERLQPRQGELTGVEWLLVKSPANRPLKATPRDGRLGSNPLQSHHQAEALVRHLMETDPSPVENSPPV